jgi:hypothetical protein
MTRKSGYSAQAPIEIAVEHTDRYRVAQGQELTFVFELPEAEPGERLGFGGWFAISGDVDVSIHGGPSKRTLAIYQSPNWSKVGSQWVYGHDMWEDPRLTFRGIRDGTVAVYSLRCGVVAHSHYDSARPELLKNMHQFAPEANIYDERRTGAVTGLTTIASESAAGTQTLYLKSCNRCARLLPINVDDERAHLSYSNHCVAVHRRPCRHSGFGRIRDASTGTPHEFELGFQLECRFCKKFEVNAAHNPQRTTAQMKEDGQRRRGFELLLEHLYEDSDQLRYRHATGRELADDIYERFDGQCFKCVTPLASPSDMHLDHTRPLALLWPLDGSATALCPTCNSEKRDRPPSEFYSFEELERLSEITGLPLDELLDPSPNMEALELLRRRSSWFCTEFLRRDELQQVRDGKRTADLLVKALDKALSRNPGGAPYQIRDLCGE